MRIFRQGRKETPSGGEPIQRPEPGKVPEKKLFEMAVAPIASKTSFLAGKYPDLNLQVVEEGETVVFTVEEIGTRLTTFIDRPEILEELGKKKEAVEAARQLKKRKEAVRHLIALEGEGAEEVRAELAWVLWCHPDGGVREEVVALVDKLEDEDTRIQLLQRMEYDSNAIVQEAVRGLLQYKGTGKAVA